MNPDYRIERNLVLSVFHTATTVSNMFCGYVSLCVSFYHVIVLQ